MQINDDWSFDDRVSGLILRVVKGKALDRLQIETKESGQIRDLWFTKDGEFDGTGGVCRDTSKEGTDNG